MRINHSFFSNLAFKIAEKNIGSTNINPSVGCLVVKNNSVISSGVTSVNGRPHAEFNALKKNIDFTGSEMYLTLEPCTHFGLTPPCTEIIKKKKIKRVFYCFNDPDVRTYKMAKKELGKKNIKLIKINNLKNNFYESYFFNKKKDLPFLDAKIALSKDLFTIHKKSKWITNYRSRIVGHLIRSRYDGIISTSKSINKDNSLLNCRIDGLNQLKPDLFIIDRNLKLKKNLKLLNLSSKRKTFIFTISNNINKINYFKKKGCRIIKLKKLNSKQDFNVLLRKIYKLNKRRLIVESGLIFLNILIKNKLINNLFIFKSNKRLKNKGYNNDKFIFLKKNKLNNALKVNLNGDKLFKLRIK